MNYLVSVIIPTYGGGQYLERAVDSVLGQTYQNIEIIIVDDNGLGTPNQLSTKKNLEKYEENPRVKYICHKVNKNGSAARNTGFANSTGDFIALLDDDDEYFPEKIEKQVNDITKLGDTYAFVYCRFLAVYKEKTVESKQGKSGNLFYEVMMHDVDAPSSSLLIRRRVWEEMRGFDESFRRHQDYEFTARVAFKYNIYAEDFVGYKYIILYRNTPNAPFTTYQYKKHYIEKMMPYIATLPKSQQDDIVVSNMMAVCLHFLYLKQYKNFLKSVSYTRPDLKSWCYMIKRIAINVCKKLK